MANISLTTQLVGSITGSFYIPSYQRGYRWGKEEVERLLDDIYGNECLDNYESEENYVLEYVEPQLVISKNRNVAQSPYDSMMFEREVKVIEMLVREGLSG